MTVRAEIQGRSAIAVPQSRADRLARLHIANRDRAVPQGDGHRTAVGAEEGLVDRLVVEPDLRRLRALGQEYPQPQAMGFGSLGVRAVEAEGLDEVGE